MRSLAWIAAVLLCAGFSAAQAASSQAGSPKAEILAIEPHGGAGPVHKATDAPPPQGESSYDVTVQIGDMVYVGRYQHASDFVPGNWQAGKPVEARVGPHKHRIYLKDVSGKEIALPIMTRRPAKDTAAEK